MFTRVVNFQFKPEKTKEALAITHEIIKPALEQIDGVRLMVVNIDRNLGLGSATTIYDSRESAGEAKEVVDHIWGFLSSYLLEPPLIQEMDTIFWIENKRVVESIQ